ncbi:hypothetical protein [Prosthecomicrobium sp. N25]|uniref:hypothetical protein n=1 Tax=Prosthecomicrobium sp. N25 TaxID=3129254 RepID=UPI0030776169
MTVPTARFYAIKPDVVDKVLGPGTYANWKSVQDAFIEEQTRAYTNEQRYKDPWAAALKARLDADLAFAEAVIDDYLVFLESATRTGAAVAADGERIFDIAVLAISILAAVNDLLDDMWGLGIAALLTALAGARIDAEARALEGLLKRLRLRLEQAKREVKEAYVQLGIDAAVVAIGLCSGPLGWLAIGAMGLGQMVADTYLGPSTSDALTWGSRGNTSLGAGASAAERYMTEASRVRRIAKPAGKVLIVVGFVFDANEIRLGYNNVDDIGALMKQVKAEQDKLIDKIRFHRHLIGRLAARFEDLRQEVERRKSGMAAATRETLEAEMRRTGYRPKL